MLFIGICGKMGSGKDYIADNVIIPILVDYGVKYMKLNFADQLKVNVSVSHNIHIDKLTYSKTKDTRYILQDIGTHEKVVNGEDKWVKFFDAWAKMYELQGIECVICTDIRFRNEFEYMYSKTFKYLIKVYSHTRTLQRNTEQEGQMHESETSLDCIPEILFDKIIKN